MGLEEAFRRQRGVGIRHEESFANGIERRLDWVLGVRAALAHPP